MRIKIGFPYFQIWHLDFFAEITDYSLQHSRFHPLHLSIKSAKFIHPCTVVWEGGARGHRLFWLFSGTNNIYTFSVIGHLPLTGKKTYFYPELLLWLFWACQSSLFCFISAVFHQKYHIWEKIVMCLRMDFDKNFREVY